MKVSFQENSPCKTCQCDEQQDSKKGKEDSVGLLFAGMQALEQLHLQGVQSICL